MKGNNKLIATYKLADYAETSELAKQLVKFGYFYDYERVVPACCPHYIGICNDKEYVELMSYHNFNKDIKEFTDKDKFIEFASTYEPTVK